MSVKSKAGVSIYEVAGEEQAGIEQPVLECESHWNDSSMIVIQAPSNKPITVAVKDLLEAVRRCSQ